MGDVRSESTEHKFIVTVLNLKHNSERVAHMTVVGQGHNLQGVFDLKEGACLPTEEISKFSVGFDVSEVCDSVSVELKLTHDQVVGGVHLVLLFSTLIVCHEKGGSVNPRYIT